MWYPDLPAAAENNRRSFNSKDPGPITGLIRFATSPTNCNSGHFCVLTQAQVSGGFQGNNYIRTLQTMRCIATGQLTIF